MSKFAFTLAQRNAIDLIAKSRAQHTLLYGGSRSGKTFVLVSLCVLAALRFPGLRVAILRRHLKDVRESVFMDTFPRVLKTRFGMSMIDRFLNKSDYVCRFDNGSEIWFGGLDDKDRVEKILGKEYGLIYFNEVSQIPYQSVEVAKTRIAQKVTGWRNRFFYDCNPPRKHHWVYKVFVLYQTPNKVAIANPEQYVSMKMNPADNAENVSSSYLDILANLKGDSYKRFCLGEFTDDNENALWKRTTMIDPFRALSAPADLERIVVGVDPAVTASEQSDLTGIVIAGKKRKFDGRSHYYVLDDVSLSGTPSEWARVVHAVFEKYQADRVVAEVNQGGDLVTSVLRQINANLPIHAVHATRGKIVRAEPIAALYEQGLVHHVGELNELEDELTSYTGDTSESSPDRMDALVWALTELADDTDVMVGKFSFL
ncbi:MAG: phage terminase large subunit [Thermoguttaceae bacterium]|nr:phage terminase large subunit [Thermoguttaceae bacterium]